MKNKSDILVGMLVGVIAFVSLIVLRPLVYEYQHRAIADAIEEDPFLNSALYNDINSASWYKAYSVDLGEESKKLSGNLKTMLTGGNAFEANFKNLYGMMLWVGVKDPEETAIVEIAKGYNITPLEASDILNGAIEPVLRILPGGSFSSSMTQRDVFLAAEEFRREFSEIYEIYQLKQELTSSAYLSEIFSNGDLDDSGFDLVNDLAEIETILFDMASPIEGVDLGSDDDFSADDLGMEDTNYHNEEPTSPSISTVYQALDLKTGESPAESAEGLEEFAPEELVEYLEEDVCPKEDEDPLETALDDYDEEIEEYFGENPPEEEAVAPEEGAIAPEEEEAKSLEEKLKPEEPKSWRREETCDGIVFFGSDLTNAVQAGGVAQTDTTTKSGVPIAEVEFYICLDYSEKWETYKSFVPDAPCFVCEFEKILAYMNKTISSSMLPNKLTGNILESSLCKKGLLDALSKFNIYFFTILAPIETPPGGDAIYGKSIFEEWDSFISKNHPLLLEVDGEPIGHSLIEEYKTSRATNWVQQNTSSDDMADVLQEISLMQEQMTNETANEVEQYQVQSAAEDFAAYSESVLLEVGQMKEYFKAFAEHFEKVANEEGFCKSITTKKVCE